MTFVVGQVVILMWIYLFLLLAVPCSRVIVPPAKD